MKTKEQILDWLDEQPWASEFYKTVFTLRVNLSLSYNESFISNAFDWTATSSGTQVWAKRDTEFRKWYYSNDKPMSWKEYCEQNPIKEGEGYISELSDINLISNPHDRNENEDINTMPEYLCKAFLAYMKLIQLQNAWMEDCKNGDENLYRIVWSPNKGFWSYGGWNGLSFSTKAMAEEFINTFKDLLEVAKPLI